MLIITIEFSIIVSVKLSGICYTIFKNCDCGDSAKKLKPFLHQMFWGCSSAWLERLPVTQEAAGSSPVTPASTYKNMEYNFINI